MTKNDSKKSEWNAITLIFVATVCGSLTSLALSGCGQPTSLHASTVSATETADSSCCPCCPKATSCCSEEASAELLVSVKDDTPISGVQEYKSPEEVMESGDSWPQWGGTRLGNNAPNVTGLPATWIIGDFDRQTDAWDKDSSENIRWVTSLGSQTYGNPVIADGKVFVGTNNGSGYLKRYPSEVDLGCLIALDDSNGDFLWQHSSEKLITGRVHDWPLQGICCAPLVEGDRLWFVTNRGEVRCLDTNGFYDNEDDGPVVDEPAKVAEIMNAGDAAQAYTDSVAALSAGKLSQAAKDALSAAGEEVQGDVAIKTITADKVWSLAGNFGGVDRELSAKIVGPRLVFSKTLGTQDKREADTVWVYDMMDELGVSQHNMAACSVTSYGDLLFVNTSNGMDEAHINLPAPDAPSFLCMDKNTAEVYWTDRSPGVNILHGQWSSPTVAVFDGTPQALFAGGDGYLYSFRADKGSEGKPELLWKFDCNPKESKWVLGGKGTRNNIIATPVAYDGKIFVAVGQDPEHGEGEGHLWCIDPTRRGDVSPELAVKIQDDGSRTPIEHRRLQAVIPENGEAAVANPNSAAVWHYRFADQNGDGEYDFEEEMHRSCGTVAIKDDVLYIADFAGLVHCLSTKPDESGMPIVHFTYDMFAQSWGSPLIADGHVYIGDEDGDVAVFEFGPENKEPIEEINMETSVYSTPVAAKSTLFISTKDKLFAIGKQSD
ncbi:PQQ-binding-like beta-propeller repeat protein [Novipirellula aureliae]|nr:PQQ-binding-like beta-propeller repeat protein [Novipirellula aureliae]